MAYDIIIGRDEADKKRFGDKGLIYIGKGYVKMGQYTSLSNKILMDVARSHVVLVAGKRGSGKCLHGDTIITLADGSQIPIKDLENNKEKIISLNNKLKIETSEKSDFFSRKVDRLLKIKLRSGKEIKLTPEHPLLTIKGWQEVQNLKIGSRIATPRILPAFGNNEMPEHEIKLLAYLIAEGHTKSIVLFANSDEKIVNDFRESLKKFDSTLELIKEKEYHYRISSPNWKTKIVEHDLTRNNLGQFIKGSKNIHETRSIRKLIEREELFGLLATQKYLSQNIMHLNKNSLKLFLSRLFSCDGSIFKTNDYWQTSYGSSSKKMIRQIQNILLRFGILSRLRDKKIKLNGKIFDSYELVINAQNTLKFIEEIGFFGKKEERQKVAKEEIISKIQNPNIDTVPQEVWELYKPKNWAEIGRQLGYAHPKAMRERIHYAPSRQTLMQIAEVEQSNPLMLLAQSDVFWDEIVSVELLEGDFTVYDICVPNNHNFVANDIIVHNSYTIGAIMEELSNLPQETAKNIASIIFDTMGIFWTMKYENEKDKELLHEWELKSKSLPVKVFVPFGKVEDYKQKNIPVDSTFALKASELEAEDWLTIFNIEVTSLHGVLIERIVTDLLESKREYNLEDIQIAIEEDKHSERNTKEVASALFSAANTWGIFAKKAEEGTEISDLVNAGTTTVLDISVYSSVGAFNIRALVISLICRKLFKTRMDARKKEELEAIRHGQEYLAYKSTREEPLVWVFIDECLPGNTEIITDKAHTPIQEIIKKVENGEKINVLGFDTDKREFAHYPVTNVYKKGKKKLIEITTECGRKIKCTPEHRILTRGCFASAFSVNEIASPLTQHYSENKECIKARLIGHLFGDGWASEKTQSLGFAGKVNPNDLNKIKNDLSLLGLKSSNIYSRKTKSTITDKNNKKIEVIGTSHSISASFNAYRYFDKLGIIKGDKITQRTVIPEWIENGSDKIKAEFLAALMGSDGNKLSKAKNARGDFNAIRISFNKLESLEKEAFEYADEIRALFESFGVRISSIAKRPGNIRKNRDKTIKIVITLEKNLPNIIRFLEKIGYRYCTEKEVGSLKWCAYLKARLFVKKEREKIYEKVMKSYSEGLKPAQISRNLNFPDYIIGEWIRSNSNPGLPKTFPDFEKWIYDRIEGNILYERIFKMEEAGEEEVYDISVDKVHNFVSNGLITHNCHEFLPREGKTPATDALVQLLREGRQPGISLVMATQQPGKIHTDVMTQSDIVIAHRVTARPDVEALNEIMQTYLLENIRSEMNKLPSLKGSAILLDDNSERLYPIRVRPRFTWHGGEAPTAIKAEVRI